MLHCSSASLLKECRRRGTAAKKNSKKNLERLNCLILLSFSFSEIFLEENRPGDSSINLFFSITDAKLECLLAIPAKSIFRGKGPDPRLKVAHLNRHLSYSSGKVCEDKRSILFGFFRSR